MYLALVRGNGSQLIADKAVPAGDASGENVRGGDAEPRDALFDDPVVGGADCPDLHVRRAKLFDQTQHLGKDIWLDEAGKEGSRGGAHFIDAEAGVHLHNLAADGQFGDFAAQVAAVAIVDAVGGVARDQSGLHGPAHKG